MLHAFIMRYLAHIKIFNWPEIRSGTLYIQVTSRRSNLEVTWVENIKVSFIKLNIADLIKRIYASIFDLLRVSPINRLPIA